MLVLVVPRTATKTTAPMRAEITHQTRAREFGAPSMSLPQEANCIPVIPHFCPNLALSVSKVVKPFLLSLPITFLALMGTRHHLSGKNHRAIVDAQQLRYMAEVFGDLCKQLEDRPDDGLLKLRQAQNSSGVSAKPRKLLRQRQLALPSLLLRF